MLMLHYWNPANVTKDEELQVRSEVFIFRKGENIRKNLFQFDTGKKVANDVKYITANQSKLFSQFKNKFVRYFMFL